MIINPYTQKEFAETQLKANKASHYYKLDKNNFAYILPITKKLNIIYATKFHKKLNPLAKKHNCVYTLIESYLENKKAKPTKNPIKQIIPRFTTVLDLTRSNEEILNRMHPKGRYNIKLAEKKGVEIKETTDVETFYNILKTTADRDEFAINNLEYYKTFYQNLAKQNKAKIFIAYYNNEAIAGLINVYFDTTAIYFYGASSNQYRNLMAPYLLQWNAIQDAKKHKFKHYDFLGIANPHDPKDKLAGVTYFKQKFGGQLVKWPASQIIINNPFWYSLLKIRKFFK
jgi:lipid II:glycine glycyltransferase (peptidoglycan interpeptide bridge formation enzyme)